MSVKRREPLRSSLRSFEIAEAVVQSATPVTLDHIAHATGIPKSTAHRLIKLMAGARVLLREAGPKRYSAGARLSAMVVGIMSKSTLRDERRAILKGLVDQIGETCNFTTLDGTELIYVDRVEASWPLGLTLQPGSKVPIHCTASGKVFLSQIPARLRRRILYGAPLQRFTSKTITDPAQLEKELIRIRKTRVSTDDEGFLAGLIAVAVPVFGRDRRVIATVSVHAPTARMSLTRALKHVNLLRRAAGDLGRIYRQFE
jgi:IclR family transcriptional regulator, acetate operon repressor